MRLDYRDRVAAVTGAASGMGRSLAKALAARGCHLALSDVNAEGLLETVRDLPDSVRVSHEVVDVADPDAVTAWGDEAHGYHGEINLVFNNAGVVAAATIDDYDPADLKWVMDVNFGGVVNGTRAFLPHLKAAAVGHIVNTLSVFGLIGFPSMGLYNASKFAVRGFTEALQQELRLEGSHVKATVVFPGGVKTGMAKAARIHPAMEGRWVPDNEQARIAFEDLFFLSSEDAAAQILRGVARGRRRVLVGRDAVLIDLLQRLLPTRYQDIGTRFVRRRLGVM